MTSALPDLRNGSLSVATRRGLRLTNQVEGVNEAKGICQPNLEMSASSHSRNVRVHILACADRAVAKTPKRFQG
jgi:hypothetical protein